MTAIQWMNTPDLFTCLFCGKHLTHHTLGRHMLCGLYAVCAAACAAGQRIKRTSAGRPRHTTPWAWWHSPGWANSRNWLFLNPKSRETLFPWPPLQIGGTGALSPLGKANNGLQRSQ